MIITEKIVRLVRGTKAKMLAAGLLPGQIGIIWDDTLKPRLAIGDKNNIPQEVAPPEHIHVISDVTGLQTALDAKASTAHASTHATGGTDALTPAAIGAVAVGGALGTPSSGSLVNCTFPTLNQSTTGSAATLTTARTFGISGGATGTATSFDGSANITVPITALDASYLAGTIPSAVLGNSSVYIGTTAVPLNRASAALTLAGVSVGGNAATVTVAANTANASYYPLFATAASGSLAPQTSTKFTINPSTGALSATSFTGAGTGLTGTAANLTAGAVSSITNSQVTMALGFTPYNATNPSSFITLATAITGYAMQASAALAPTDTLLAALGKLEGNANSRSLSSHTHDYSTVYAPLSHSHSWGDITGEIPIASSSTLGGVKVGGGLSVTSDGTLSASSATNGAYRNYRASCTGLSDALSMTADFITLRDANGGYIERSGVSGTLHTTTAAGINSIDTGTSAINTWYHKYFVYNPSTGAVGTLYSLSATGPSFANTPGYSHWMRMGAFRTDSTNRYPLAMTWVNGEFTYKVTVGSNVVGLPMMAAGNMGDVSVPTWVALAVANFVPPTSSAIDVIISRYDSTAGGASIAAPNNSYGAYNSETNPPPLSTGISASSIVRISKRMLLESSNIYYASTISAWAYLMCAGGVDPI